MSGDSSYDSIAAALEKAEKEKAAKAVAELRRSSSSPWFKGGAPSKPAGGAAPKAAGARPAGKPAGRSGTTSNIADLRDEFDYAIEAVEMARAKGGNKASVEQSAVSYLMARCRLPRPEASDLVTRAVRYLDK